MVRPFTPQRPSGPVIALTPRFRCSHGAGGAVREADRALVTGRFARALDAYLRILADHPRNGGFCDRVLRARTAEAALAARCPGIAHDLAAAAVRHSGGAPVGAEAVLTARALALRARAHLASGRTEAAAATLRRAQSTAHRDPAVDKLVRMSAAEIHLARETPGEDLDSALDPLLSMLSRHRLNPSKPGVSPPLLIGLGRSLLRLDRIELACEIFALAAQHTGVTGWIGRHGIFALGEHHPESHRRWRYAVAQWTEALCEEAHCRAALGSECFDSESWLLYGLAATSAANCGDAETAARLAACGEYLHQRAGTGRGEWVVPREPEANFPFLFADRAAQRRWAALHDGVGAIRIASTGVPSASEQGDPQQLELAWWAGRSDPRRLRDAARTADDVFSRLNASAPETFGALYGTVGRTIGELQALIGGEPILGAAQQGVTAADPAARPTSAGARPAGYRRDLSMPRLPVAVGPYKDPVAAIPRAERPQPGAFLPPLWLDEAVRETGERCWTVLTAAAEAHRLGHSHVGSEHLLLAVSGDGECAALLRPLGIGPEAVRRCVTGLIGPDPRRRAAVSLTVRARALLALAGAHARHRDTGRVRPVYVLGALVLDGRGVGAHILTTLGADRDELLARVRGHTAPDAPAGLPRPAIEGLPPLGRYTAAARRAVDRAGRWAAASTSGLLDPVLLLRALAAEGWAQTEHLPPELDGLVRSAADAAGTGTASPPGSVPSPGSAPSRVTLTPAARRILVTASAESARRCHPGVDVDQLMRTALRDRTPPDAFAPGEDEAAPALDDDAMAVLDAAHASAAAAAVPYIGPEHLATAVDGNEDGAPLAAGLDRPRSPGELRPAVPLPLTPRAAEALATAVAHARSDRHAAVTKADLVRGLARIAPASETRPPGTGAQPPGTAEDTNGQQFHTHLVRLLERALNDIDRQTTRLLERGHSVDGDEDEHNRRLREVQDVRGERLEVLRLLCRHAPDQYETQLIEGLITTARGRQDALASSALEEAARRARRVVHPSREQALGTARTLTEIAVVHQESDRGRTALSLYDEALARLAAAQDEPGGTGEGADLRDRALVQRAQCLAADGPEAETAALLLACDHHCRRLETAPSSPHHAQAMATVERMAQRLSDIGRHDKALVVTSRALDAGVTPSPELAGVHAERSHALWMLNRGDLGRGDLDSAVRLAPEHPLYVTRRGSHLMWTGHLDAAIADFDRALALAPGFSLPRRRRGEAHLRAGRHADALSDLDAVLPHDPVPTAALVPRGQALRALGDVKAALRDLTSANATDPNCSWTRYQYALALAATGSVDRSRRQLGAAIRQESMSYRVPDPWRFTSAANLAVYHAALGAGPQAHRWLRTALNYRHHPWMVADFRSDLEELSRTIPELTALCEELADVQNAANGHAVAER
ncbi:hypothetical protein C1I97_23600 [Streptomyces sp. NTH33]|uniref:tetratricopeptide repeat protein n=1 Tax=Streptomyces sp. NTH33 TaxID=1735453 RepID=UPI000DA80D83|nr:Clp protease N-terminal domain-containing protein [Streptomyces sp. NTH33]PZH00016.1 hypothetical protein C1I97_23600 [Streptomyces sp. NTH33]